MAKEYSALEPFSKAIYSEKRIPLAVFLNSYQNELAKRGDFSSIIHSKRISQYNREIFDNDYISELQYYFFNWFMQLSKEYPKLEILLGGRIKSVESFDRKVVKNINEAASRVDEIHDTVALRFVISGNYSSNQLISLCYEIMNNLIYNTTVDSNYTPGPAGKLNDVMDMETRTNSGIVIPTKSKIDPMFANVVKDYIINPKTNGYQSLHAYFTRQPGGQEFEIQVRTYDMHTHAESGDAAWAGYKKKKYQFNKIDRERINIEKYKYQNGVLLYDNCGIQLHRQILLLEKSAS
ncbi:MAG: hypothetical protein IKQ33_05900 [Clostridia bacterium]|nr:hypothetical protein [Clostridia bacterium]